MLGADHSGNVCWATHSRAMLRAVLDAVLPSYQVRERHQTTVYASPEAAFAAALTVPAACDPIVAALFWFRRIPGGSLPLRDFFPQLGIRPAISTPTAFVGLGDFLGVTIAFGIWAVPLGPAGGTRLATENARPCHRLRRPTAVSPLLVRRRSLLRPDPPSLARRRAAGRRGRSLIRPRMCAKVDSRRSRRAERRSPVGNGPDRDGCGSRCRP